jgi:hypothetical protein
VEQAGGSTLTWQTYRELGGLQGAIAGRTDEMVAELGRDLLMTRLSEAVPIGLS